MTWCNSVNSGPRNDLAVMVQTLVIHHRLCQISRVTHDSHTWNKWLTMMARIEGIRKENSKMKSPGRARRR